MSAPGTVNGSLPQHLPETQNTLQCDQQQPDCLKCTKSGRTCEGYAKFPTFLNKTISGPEKRHGLEEAKPRSFISTASTSSVSSRRVSPSEGTLQLTRRPSPTEIYDVQLVAQFWQSWIPIASGSPGEWNGTWLQHAISAQKSTKALDLSIKALAFTRLGWLRHDTALTTRGTALYGHALRELQRALWDDRTMWLDVTLAAAFALSVYELFETTTSSIKGWNSHLTGLGNLVRLRGPHRHQAPLGRAVFESFRFSSMIQSVQFRKKSFLLERDWQESPWKYGAKDIFQRLCDIGFKIGALQSQIDDAGLQRGELTSENARMFMGYLKLLEIEMDTWYREHLSVSPSPLYWVSKIQPSLPLEEENTESAPLPGPFTFPTLRHATITLTYWALRIVIAATFRQLLHEIDRVSTSPSPPASTQPARDSPPNQRFSQSEQQPIQDPIGTTTRDTPSNLNTDLPLRNPTQRPLPTSQSTPMPTKTDNAPITLAINIMRTMPYCLSDEQGMLGAQQSLFALRGALFILRLYPGMELRWCQGIYRVLDQRKGLRYAKEIAKLDGGHGTRGNERERGVTPAQTPPHPREYAGPYTLGQEQSQ